jgi:hypothetical protein
MVANGAVVSAEQLLEQVSDEFADQFTNAVAVTMLRLRRKLGEPPLIETVIVTRSSDALVRQPWRTSVRARIALTCGGLSVVVGAALIAGTYALARGISFASHPGPSQAGTPGGLMHLKGRWADTPDEPHPAVSRQILEESCIKKICEESLSRQI